MTGDLSEINNLKTRNTKIINLEGKTMIPGFIEGHAHIMGTGYNQKNLDLLNTTSYDEIIQLVKEKSNSEIILFCFFVSNFFLVFLILLIFFLISEFTKNVEKISSNASLW